jgi:sugar/nucleoside kinase (ribokinase family)
VRELFQPGGLVEMGPVTLSTGGPVSNTGINLRTLGMRVELMGKIGDDALAESLLQLLAERGLEKSMARVPGEQTSYTIVLAPPGVDRMFLHCPGANDTFSAQDVDYDAVSRARLFHLGYPPVMKRLYREDGAELAEIYRRVKALDGVTTSLDMALPDPASEAGRADWRLVLENVLPYVDVFLPSAEEILFMLDRDRFLAERERASAEGRTLIDAMTGDDLSSLGDRLLDLGVRVACIKCGERGLYARTAGRELIDAVPALNGGNLASDWAACEYWHAALRVDSVGSATGSGDAAIAGFLASMLRGLSLEDSLGMANAVGASNVTAVDALSGVKSWEETRDRLNRGWMPADLEVKGAGWRAIDRRRLWAGPRHREPGS